jgi:hypothetical protein
VLGSNQRPRDSGWRGFLRSLDYLIALGGRTASAAPRSGAGRSGGAYRIGSSHPSLCTFPPTASTMRQLTGHDAELPVHRHPHANANVTFCRSTTRAPRPAARCASRPSWRTSRAGCTARRCSAASCCACRWAGPSRTGWTTSTSTSNTTCATSRCPSPGRLAAVLHPGLAHPRPRAGPEPPAVGDLRHRGPGQLPRPARRQLCAADQDPPRRASTWKPRRDLIDVLHDTTSPPRPAGAARALVPERRRRRWR